MLQRLHRPPRGSPPRVPPFAADLLDHLAADVRGHHDDRVGEIDRVALVVGQPAVVEHLQRMLNTSRWAFSISSSRITQ